MQRRKTDGIGWRSVEGTTLAGQGVGEPTGTVLHRKARASSHTSFPRKRESRNVALTLDSRFRGNDKQVQFLDSLIGQTTSRANPSLHGRSGDAGLPLNRVQTGVGLKKDIAVANETV